MAHVFDTGEAFAQRTALRRGAVALIAELRTGAPNNGYLQAVIGWDGVIRSYQDADSINDLFATLNGRSPAVAISLGDRHTKSKMVGGFNSKGEIELSAYFFSNHARDMLDGRLEIDAVGLASDVANPGLDIAMEHVEELLIGRYPGSVPSIKQIESTAEELIIAATNGTIWVQRYTVTVDRVINRDRDVTDMITEFMTTMKLAGSPDTEPLVTELTVLSNAPVSSAFQGDAFQAGAF